MAQRQQEWVRVGFGSADLSAALPADQPVRDGVQARAFYAHGADTDALWAVLDFMDLNRPFVTGVRDAIAQGTGVPPRHVHVVSTHNHAASDVAHLDAAAAARAGAVAARAAVDAAAPARMRYAQERVEPALTLTRRREIAELGGAISCFYGVTAEDGFSCEPVLRQAVRMLVGQGRMAYRDHGLREPVPQEHFIDAALAGDPRAWRMPSADPLLQALRFEAENGEPLGTIVRFASHVVNCNGQGFYSGDFPSLLTQSLESRLGGGCVFFNGPCADISPATRDKRAGFEQVMARRLAEVTMAALEGQPAEPLTVLRDRTEPVLLPCRQDFPRDAQEQERGEQRLQTELEATPVDDLVARKVIGEQRATLGATPFLRERWEPQEEPEHLDAEHPVLRIELGGLRLNRVLLVGFPGETFHATEAALTSPAEDMPVITVTEHGRTAMYMPPPEQLAQGGYESTCRLVDERGEPTLRAAALELLGQLAG